MMDTDHVHCNFWEWDQHVGTYSTTGSSIWQWPRLRILSDLLALLAVHDCFILIISPSCNLNSIVSFYCYSAIESYLCPSFGWYHCCYQLPWIILSLVTATKTVRVSILATTRKRKRHSSITRTTSIIARKAGPKTSPDVLVHNHVQVNNHQGTRRKTQGVV